MCYVEVNTSVFFLKEGDIRQLKFIYMDQK